jgi:hypothetical protein
MKFGQLVFFRLLLIGHPFLKLGHALLDISGFGGSCISFGQACNTGALIWGQSPGGDCGGHQGQRFRSIGDTAQTG